MEALSVYEGKNFNKFNPVYSTLSTAVISGLCDRHFTRSGLTQNLKPVRDKGSFPTSEPVIGP